MIPTVKEPGPEAYDEFEAALNGSGLVIRVLKDTHRVESIKDGAESKFDNPNSDDEREPKQSAVSMVLKLEIISSFISFPALSRWSDLDKNIILRQYIKKSGNEKKMIKMPLAKI